jgi:hypothetical protein
MYYSKLTLFMIARHFHPSLILGGKAYQEESLMGLHFKGRLLALSINIGNIMVHQTCI